jgi:uncharacterized protein YaiI (UPF0178 family)
MTLWLDADALPRDIREIVFRAARRLKLPTILVANTSLPTPADCPTASCVVVAGGADVADTYIVDHADPADVAVTADIPLAARLIGKGLAVVDPRGREFTPGNIAELLSTRDLLYDLRGTGQVTGGPAPFHARHRQEFANALDRVLTRRLAGR